MRFNRSDLKEIAHRLAFKASRWAIFCGKRRTGAGKMNVGRNQKNGLREPFEELGHLMLRQQKEAVPCDNRNRRPTGPKREQGSILPVGEGFGASYVSSRPIHCAKR